MQAKNMGFVNAVYGIVKDCQNIRNPFHRDGMLNAQFSSVKNRSCKRNLNWVCREFRKHISWRVDLRHSRTPQPIQLQTL